MGTILDAAYGSHLRGSLHEQPNASLAKAASQALDRPLRAACQSRRAVARGRAYRLVLVLRLDLVPLWTRCSWADSPPRT